MAHFALLRGTARLATWQLTDGTEVTSGSPMLDTGGPLVVPEQAPVAFLLSGSQDWYEYRILVGDVPVPDQVYPMESGELVWASGAHFESARGNTPIFLEQRQRNLANADWRPLLDCVVYVLPSKVGEQAYQQMAEDLQQLSHSLLMDLYGKSRSTYDLRFARSQSAFRSRDEELSAVEAVLNKLGILLPKLASQPVSRVRRETGLSDYWGQQQLTPRECTRLARQGIRATTAPRPIRIKQGRLVESFDVPEHRALKGFLALLRIRARQCAQSAADHVRLIEADRPLRDIAFSTDEPSLYASQDIPRIHRLEDACRRARQAAHLATTMMAVPLLANVPAALAPPVDGAFGLGNEYRHLRQLMEGFLQKNAVWQEGGDTTSVTKLTSRLFEQWTYLRLVDAFRIAGLDLQDWGESLRQQVRSQFLVDFHRGLCFEGQVAQKLRLRFRYEPWILGQASATAAGETLYRGIDGRAAWCPDVVIECLRRQEAGWVPVYVIVLDMKYTSRLSADHWDRTQKYRQIRAVQSRRQVVKQLWLVSPSAQGAIVSKDPAVTFEPDGPSCPIDEDADYELNAVLCRESTPESLAAEDMDPFERFAIGTLAYLRRNMR